jgi:hypothetical protein
VKGDACGQRLPKLTSTRDEGPAAPSITTWGGREKGERVATCERKGTVACHNIRAIKIL